MFKSFITKELSHTALTFFSHAEKEKLGILDPISLQAQFNFVVALLVLRVVRQNFKFKFDSAENPLFWADANNFTTINPLFATFTGVQFGRFARKGGFSAESKFKTRPQRPNCPTPHFRQTLPLEPAAVPAGSCSRACRTAAFPRKG